jgi:hypothetical protein
MSYPEARYRGDQGEVSARYRPAEQGPELTIGSGTALRYLATGASTQGQFGLYRWDARPHTPGPSAHFHRTISESFFILSGTVRLFNGERGIFCTSPKEACTPSRTIPTSRPQCCSSSHPVRRAKRTLRRWPRKPRVVSSARKNGKLSASVMTITLSDRRFRIEPAVELRIDISNP